MFINSLFQNKEIMKPESKLEHLPEMREDDIGHCYLIERVVEIGELWDNQSNLFDLVYVLGVVRGSKNLLVYNTNRTNSNTIWSKGMQIDEKFKYRKISDMLLDPPEK
jgi:hypothetical protein